jgi:magnesium transporter
MVGTIFIPLTFIAGIYGMNFENMPELKSQNGYFVVLGAMAATGISLAVYFKRKNWW